MPKLNFAHICDMAFLSQDKKLNIIGVFERIFAQKFPLRYPKMSVVMNLSIEKGTHELLLLLQKKGGEKPVLQMKGEVKAAGSENINLIFDLANISFEDQREYAAEIFLNGEEMGAVPFSVELAPRS